MIIIIIVIAKSKKKLILIIIGMKIVITIIPGLGHPVQLAALEEIQWVSFPRLASLSLCIPYLHISQFRL
jgi:hypothetical protein